MDAGYRIREAGSGDLDAIVALEAAVFPNPWSLASFRRILDVATMLVAERDGTIVGYVIVRAVADEGEVLNLAVAEGSRRAGIGTALLTAAIEQLLSRGVRNIYLEVRASALGAQTLYRRMGFEEVGRRFGYYIHPREDAVVFRRGTDATQGPAIKG
jgi:ribosomal-protein-alanine N-acetyltransferase